MILADAAGGICRLVTGPSSQWHGDVEEARPRIYFANHTSHLDFPLIWSALPATLRARVRPVAGRDYWERTAPRRFMADRVFHAVLVDRGARASGLDAARASIRTMAAALDRGHSLIVFPEGTRSRDGSLGPFKSGLYHLSRARPDVACVPVFIGNAHRILPKGEAMPVPLLARVVFGSPIRVEAGEDKQTFLARARAALQMPGGGDDRTH
jgi:1-acyl-sn-glycerol-3-phosphate acyltransferase